MGLTFVQKIEQDHFVLSVRQVGRQVADEEGHVGPVRIFSKFEVEPFSQKEKTIYRLR